MFADSLLEVSWAQRSRRGWTTLTSFGLQAAVMSLLLLLPLWKTVGLMSARTVSTPISVGRAEPGPAPKARGGATSVAPSNSEYPRYVAPGRIPGTISKSDGGAVPQPPGRGGDFLPGIGIPGTPEGFPMSVFRGNYPVMPARPAPTVPTFRTSRMLEGSLVRRVQPVYPPLAKVARVQGPVQLTAIIGKAGTIEDLHVISGHPMLVAAALQAVRQWRYRPYILNGEPVEVETQITVNFTLSGS